MKKESIIFVLLTVIVFLGLWGAVTLIKNGMQGAPEPLVSPSPSPSVNPSASPSTTQSEARLDDFIVVTSPLPNATVTNPLIVRGSARGSWYSEGVFPVVLLDANGREIGQGQATANGEWMTEEYVVFAASVRYTTPETKIGTLVLKKDNPSGLPANDKSLTFPVKF